MAQGMTTESVAVLDLTSDACPGTFLRFRTVIEQMQAGGMIEVLLSKGAQMQSLPQAIKLEGHRIERVRREGDLFRLFVRKTG